MCANSKEMYPPPMKTTRPGNSSSSKNVSLASNAQLAWHGAGRNNNVASFQDVHSNLDHCRAHEAGAAMKGSDSRFGKALFLALRHRIREGPLEPHQFRPNDASFVSPDTASGHPPHPVDDF